MIVRSTFRPVWWLKNPHAQTLFPYLVRNITPPVSRKERLELPDNDFVDLFWVEEGVPTDAPLVVLLHGLGGTGQSTYIKAQQRRYQQLGWRSVVMQFRGAGDEPNRQLRAYHSGDTADLNYFLQYLVKQEPHTQKMAVGFSLGGNVLLKWLGEQRKQTLIQAAVAVSVPFQLNLVADRLNHGVSRLYRQHLLKRLKQQFVRKLQHTHNEEFLKTVQGCQCFWTFDEHVTAPLHGFESVHNYYQEASCKKYLRHIATPTLIIHAIDDPFMSPEAVPHAADLSPDVCLELSEQGGHVGFVEGSALGRPKFWLDKRVAEFFALYVD